MEFVVDSLALMTYLKSRKGRWGDKERGRGGAEEQRSRGARVWLFQPDGFSLGPLIFGHARKILEAMKRIAFDESPNSLSYAGRNLR